MVEKKSGLNLTRRTFLYSSGAALGTTAISFASQTNEFCSLYVDTIYRPLPNGQEALAGVRLRLGNRSQQWRSLEIAAADFAPLNASAAPKIELKGLDVPFRDPSQPISENSFLTIRITGVDLFNHMKGEVGGACTYLFSVAAKVVGSGEAKVVTWQIGLKTNAWINRDRKQWLDFPIVSLREPGALALLDLMEGRGGFKLELGPGWVSQTLSGIIGQEIVASGEHVAILSAKPRSQIDTFGSFPTLTNVKESVSWRWSVRPIDARSLLTMYGGIIRFRSFRFGWESVEDKELRTGAEALFFLSAGDEPPPAGGFAIDAALIAPPNGQISFPLARFSVRGERDSQFTLTGAGVGAIWNTKNTTQDISLKLGRLARLFFTGSFVASVTSGGRKLAESKYAFAHPDSSTALRLDVDANRQWILRADFPSNLSEIVDLDTLRITADAKDKVHVEDRPRQVESFGFGWLAVEASSEDSTASGVRTVATLPVGRVENLALIVSLAELPATLEREGDEAFFSQVSVVDPGLHPVLRLRDLPLPEEIDRTVDRVGFIFLDAPAAGVGDLSALDLPLDSAVVKVRRASDMLLLDFRLANLRLRSTPKDGIFILVPDPLLKPADLAPIDFPATPALRADFGPQHVAEEAFLRRENFAGGLPALDFQRLSALIGGNWPIAVAQAGQNLRKGTRAEKKAAKISLRELANEVASVFDSGEEELKDKLKAYDPGLKAKIADFVSFAKIFDQATKVSWLFLRRVPPEDQRVYAGPDDLDPDTAWLAWDLREADLRLIQRAKLIERLISVDGSYGDAVALNVDWTSLRALHPEITTLIGEIDKPALSATKFSPSPPDDAVIASLQGKWQDQASQRQASATKERVAPDYADFRLRWKSAAEAYRGSMSDSDFLSITDFVSTRWALFERRENDPVYRIMLSVVAGVVSITGEEDEPFPERSRARFSGPSRLAFQWSRRGTRADDPPAETRFALSELLDWDHRDQLVTRRARSVRAFDSRGNLVRVADQGQQLRLQGLEPGKDLSARTWMDKVYAFASTEPQPFETAIELPFRLQLSPAQDPTWIFAHHVDIDLTSASDGPQRSFGRPLWSVALQPADPDPLLRAVWSEDFWPERFRNGRDQLDVQKSRDSRDKRAAEMLNEMDGPPPRGTVAPWYYNRLRRRNGAIIDVVPDTVPDEARHFRASMDSYDRDQIVTESSVPGILVKRGVDPNTNEVIEGGDSYSPPDGFEFIDVAMEQLPGKDGGEVARVDSTAIYAPKALSFRELRLTALGGTLDLHTKFKPPVSADLLDGGNLYPALTLESWRHLAVLGRDRVVELEYKGYLFPFGHHATLVKLTERRYVQPSKAKRGPTSYLVQRIFIRCSEPLKSDWYDQPDGGRAWPVESMTILTGQTPDLVDPQSGPAKTKGLDSIAEEQPNGRISLHEGRGLVFWPRTAPFKGSEVSFEFQIDGSGQSHRMPMVFVDNEAANNEATLASLVQYYNTLSPGAKFQETPTSPGGHGFFASKLDRKSLRVFDQGGASRRYGRPLEEGQTNYETQAWAIGVEGRPGEARVRPAEDGVTKSRSKALRARSNYGFSPLLLATDQPPFYPFVQFAEIRLDRLGRLIGDRQGRECLVAFEANYLINGFADPARPASGPEAMLGILSQAVLDVGSHGDRIGAIGRLSGRLFLIARKEGPLTTGKESQLFEGGGSAKFETEPPDFNARIPRPGIVVPPAGQATSVTQQSNNVSSPPPSSMKGLLELVLGDADVTIFGSFSLIDLIDLAVIGLEEAVPSVKEVTDYAGDAAASLVAIVRTEVVPALRTATARVESEFRSAAIGVGGRSLELRRAYPDIGSALSAVDQSLVAFEQAGDAKGAGAALTGIVAAAKALIKGFEKAGRDPISPLKLELRRILLSDLQKIDMIEREVRALVEHPPQLGGIFSEAVRIGLENLGKKLSEPLTKTQVVGAIVNLMTVPQTAANGASAKFSQLAEEVVSQVYDGIVAAGFNSPAPKNALELIDRLKNSDALLILGNALVESQSMQAIRADLEDFLATVDVGARSYWSQLVLLRDEIQASLESAKAAIQAMNAATEADAKLRIEKFRTEAEEEARRLADKASRALFGVDRYTLLAEAEALGVALGQIQAQADFGRKCLAVAQLLRRLDGVFLKGRFGQAAEAAIAETFDNTRLKLVMDTVLDGYTAVLDLADSFAEQAQFKVVPVTDFAAEIDQTEVAVAGLFASTGLDGVAGQMRRLVASLDSTTGNIDAEIDNVIADLRAKLAKANGDLKIGSTPWLSGPFSRSSQFALQLTAIVGDAAKDFGKSQAREARSWAVRFFDAYDELLEKSHHAVTHGAIAAAQARFAMSGWLGLSSSSSKPAALQARDAIKQARSAPSLESYRQVVQTFPRAELSALLDAWPKAAAQTVDALRDIAIACSESMEQATRLPATTPPAADLIARRALKGIEAELQRFVEGEFKAAKDRLLAAGDSLAKATNAKAGAALQPSAQVIKTVLDARERVHQAAVEYPFLKPFADMIERMSRDLSHLPDFIGIDAQLAKIKTAGEALGGAQTPDDTWKAVRDLRTALQVGGGKDDLAAFRSAMSSTVAEAGSQTYELAVAQAAAVLASLEARATEAAGNAESWLLNQVFSVQPVNRALRDLAVAEEALRDVRNSLLEDLARDDRRLAKSIGGVMQFLKLGPDLKDSWLLPALLFVAVPESTVTTPTDTDRKIALLENYTSPQDLLEDEISVLRSLVAIGLATDPNTTQQRFVSLQAVLGNVGTDLAALQIVGNFRTVMDQILQANFASLIDFQAIRTIVEGELRKLLPTRVTTQLDYSVPLQAFPEGAPIFNPTGDGRFTIKSVNTVDFTDPLNPRFEAVADAILAPFEIKLLGNFDAITLVFSSARLTWKQGGEPHFAIDFVDYRIGSALSFVDQLAGALGQSGGGAFVRLAQGFPGIEAGYRINIPSFTLGGVTFLNVGLSAGARLPFDKRPAEFLAALSSREDPFVIIAGVWGGGGHFQLTSDGRSITGFDASFVFGGGGGVTYGPLTMVGRVTVGVFIRKVGHYTEIAGDFFAGGAGRVAIFGISASLTVTTGMTGAGDMFGSAVFRYSFSVGFAKVSFAVTVAKKESKGFGQQKQAMLQSVRPYLVASAQGVIAGGGPAGRTAQLKVSTVRQDTDYRRWQRYFSALRPEGY